MSNYWNPNNPTVVPSGTFTTGVPPVVLDPQVRIANALERIAFALETANQRNAVTVTVAPKPTRKKAIKRGR